MKTVYKIILSIAILGLIFSGCTEDITDEINLDNTERDILVVEGNINNKDTFHEVKLSVVKSYTESGLPPVVAGAKVTISSDPGENYTLTEDPNREGVYLTPKFAGEPGITYTITIQNTGIKGEDGEDFYTADCIMKQPIIMDSITYEKSHYFYTDDSLTELNEEIAEEWIYGWEQGDDIYIIRGWGRESGETDDDYYQWLYYKNGVLETDTLDETIFVDDNMVDGNEIPGLEMWYAVPARIGDTIVVESRGVTKEYYKYISGVMEETSWNSGPFGGPPANPHSNLSNGAVGFFNVYSFKNVGTVIKESS